MNFELSCCWTIKTNWLIDEITNLFSYSVFFHIIKLPNDCLLCRNWTRPELELNRIRTGGSSQQNGATAHKADNWWNPSQRRFCCLLFVIIIPTGTGAQRDERAWCKPLRLWCQRDSRPAPVRTDRRSASISQTAADQAGIRPDLLPISAERAGLAQVLI